eukprot:m.29659 g.29659  ORF g.29659 m.29659 type:complete len:197 (+) comp10462_c0_seq1:50-640(+)
MLTSQSKIRKAKGAQPDHLEEQVATALYDLQINSDKLKQALREVHITSAKEVDIGDNKRALIVFVPPPQLPVYQKMIKEKNLLEELEKKFSGKSVVVVAERRIIRKESRKNDARALKQLRPRSRTLTTVHENILEDLVYPTEIVGKRIRHKLDGSKLIKIHLNHEHKSAQDRLDTYSKVYKALTGKSVKFEFPTSA